MTAIRPNAIGAPGYSETWPCEPQTASRARSLVSAALHVWGLQGLIERGTLIVSELVGNSVRHSGCHLVRVAITRPERSLVSISVSDKSKRLPASKRAAADAEEGRGLFLVEALSERWEVVARDWGRSFGLTCE